MSALNHRALPIAIALLCTACRLRPRGGFEVAAQAEYILRAPDKHETPFPEVLREYNGFVPGKPAMDLKPEMDLRIENAYYEKGKKRTGLDGYLGTEVARYSIGAHGMKLTSLTPMQNRPEWDRPVEELIAASERHRRQFRFYWEVLFNRQSGMHGSVLLAADSPQALAELSKQLESNPEAVCNAQTAAQCAMFPEACSVSVEFPITVNGKRQMMPWGSLLKGVVNNPNSLTMKRLYNGHLTSVAIDPNDKPALSLPLLPGDRIDWN